MHAVRLSSSLIRFLTSTTSVVIASVLFLSALAAAQDSPGRFETGAAFSTLHMPGFAGLAPHWKATSTLAATLPSMAHSAGSPTARGATVRRLAFSGPKQASAWSDSVSLARSGPGF
jgi:hypothetical protein